MNKLEVLPLIHEIGMMCTIHGESFFNFTKGALWHNTNDDAGMYDITMIDEPVKGKSRRIKVTKKGKLCLNVRQVDGSEIGYTLWPVKYCKKAWANLFSLTCELS